MNTTNDTDERRRPELTIRGLIIGVIITLVFTAANVYFGLKAGLTFSTSIPAAVISMAILRSFRNATVQENNIVQTVASAAGTLSSIIFVLPGLIMIGWWTGFPFWISFLICALGGILGVMYSIPLRRALVTNSDLPYPEGVACAEVLKVGSGGDKTNAADVEHRQIRFARGGVGINRGRGLCDHRRDASIRFGCGANFPYRPTRRGQRLRFLAVVCAAGDRSPVWIVRRHRHAHRRLHWLGLARAALTRRSPAT